MNSLPKRRKYKDNPYTLNTIDNHYYILFRDWIQVIEVGFLLSFLVRILYGAFSI